MRITAAAARVAPVQAAIRFWYNPRTVVEKVLRTRHLRAGTLAVSAASASLASAKEGEQKTILQVYVSSISAMSFCWAKS